MKLKLKLNPNVKPTGITKSGQLFSAKDNSAICLESEYTKNVRPYEVTADSLHNNLLILQSLYDNKEINLAAYLVLCACVKCIEKESKTVKFKRAKMVETLNFPALINSDKARCGLRCNGEHLL